MSLVYHHGPRVIDNFLYDAILSMWINWLKGSKNQGKDTISTFIVVNETFMIVSLN